MVLCGFMFTFCVVRLITFGGSFASLGCVTVFFFYFIFYLKVFADLLVDSQKLLMVTVAAALQEIGYEFQVVSFVCVLVLLLLEYGCEESKQCF